MAGKNSKVIVITGPTASGKTSLSVRLSEYADIEIISADSRQVYKYLDIGTAKPDEDELKAVKHHFIDILYPDEYFSAGEFAKQARIVIREIFNRNKIPVIVGGSGLYIQAVCEGLFEGNENIEKREQTRKLLYKELELNGKDALYDKLKALDEEAALLYPDKNARRVIRALEHILTTGELFSDSIKKNQLNNLNCLYFGINFERNILYERINQRVDWMLKNGLIEETKNVLNLGYSAELNSLNTVGYKEIISYFDGNISLDVAIEEIKKNTRRYAKRQITWFRRNNDIHWFSPDNILTEKIINDYYAI